MITQEREERDYYRDYIKGLLTRESEDYPRENMKYYSSRDNMNDYSRRENMKYYSSRDNIKDNPRENMKDY